ncbi:hypothetical protein MVEN_01975700 [Mycena venus]|uniref:Uncharacterized protein n=1 Tax=Mycena venus TaxID=2733690 RepID=A0A8H7CIR9_9AGAR|nr:hypothetical protein MVEN_01975700 [Mycena venus]
MKFGSLLALSVLAVVPVRAWIEFDGCILVDPFLGTSISAYVSDNGAHVCDGGAHTDQDGHFCLTCWDGFIWCVTKNGAHSWLRTPAEVLDIDQTHETSSDTFDCQGACDDKHGACFRCTQYCWNFTI